MHGRVKVRTSEEEKARKEKERQEKLKVFKHAMQTIFHKRKEGELDKELLTLTAKVLSSNPDIYTLWNIRRETLIIFKNNNNESDEKLSELYDAELQLTECCLIVNPKSYCAWHHREWILITRHDPDWKKELVLCNKYLKLDERNFHTWDYRRFVVKHCKLPLEEEFEFTTEKLLENFSNYSAWHYRSKILIELYPDIKGGRPIEDNHHKHELKMVQSAAFTDPDDTSAWFYQKWLLGAVKTTTDLVVCAVSPSKTTFAFNKHVDKKFVDSKVCLLINEKEVSGEWSSSTGNEYDVLWIFRNKEDITNDLNIKVQYKTESNNIDIIPCLKKSSCFYVGKNRISFEKKYSDAVADELNKQLDSCRQLLLLEPDNRWTLLTTTVFLHCINANRYHEEVINNLLTLKTIDKLRAGYYNDFICQWSIEKQICEDYNNGVELTIKCPVKMTSLPHLQYFSHCLNVDLSNQNLTEKVLPALVVLQHCEKLSLENNNLATLKGFPSLDLKEFKVKGNAVSLASGDK